MRRKHGLTGALLAGALAIAMSAEGRNTTDITPRVYASNAQRVLVVERTYLAPLNRPPPPGKPDTVDPWTGEQLVIAARTIGTLRPDRHDPWTGVAIALPAPRAPMMDDAPYGTEPTIRDDRAPGASVIASLRIDPDWR